MLCDRCICRGCANDVDNIHAHGQQDFPCLNCDECRFYDGNIYNLYATQEAAESALTKNPNR